MSRLVLAGLWLLTGSLLLSLFLTLWLAVIQFRTSQTVSLVTVWVENTEGLGIWG